MPEGLQLQNNSPEADTQAKDIITKNQVQVQNDLKERYQKLLGNIDPNDLYGDADIGEKFKDYALRSQIVMLTTSEAKNSPLSSNRLLRLAKLIYPSLGDLSNTLNQMQKVEPQKITEIMGDKNSEVITETPKQKLITKIKETISDPRSGLDNYTKDYITQYVDEYQGDFTKVLKLSNDKILLALRDNTISSQDQNMKDPLYSFLENGELTKKESKNYDVIGDIQKSNNRAEKLIVEKQLAEEARLFAKNQAKQKNKNRGYASLGDVIGGANPYSKN